MPWFFLKFSGKSHPGKVYFKMSLCNNTGLNDYMLYGFLFDIQDTLSYRIFNNNSLGFASPATRENTQPEDPDSHGGVVRVYD
jgi:hypothetical protein